MNNCKVEKNENYAVLFLKGRIDIIVAEEIEKQVNNLFSLGFKNLIFDMKDVIYFSSSGVRLLISAKNRIEELNGKIVLSNLSSTAEKIMDTLGLLKEYRIYDKINQAVEFINS